MPSQSLITSPAVFVAIYALNFFRVGFQTVAFAWFATLSTGKLSSAALLLLTSSIATLLLAPIQGRLVDSIKNKKNLLSLSQSAIFAFGLGIIVVRHYVYFFSDLNLLLLLTIVLSGISLVASGSMDYFLRMCIPATNRARRIASINTATQVAMIGGTGAAGLTASVINLEIAVATLALLGGLTASVCFLALPDLRVASDSRSQISKSPAIHVLLYRQFPFLFCIACCSALVFSIGQITNMLLPGLIALHLKLGSLNYSTIEAAWCIGALGISAWLARFKTTLSRGMGHDLIIVIAMGLALAIVPVVPIFSALVILHFALGIGFAFVRIRTETRFLEECPIHLLGRFRANSMALTSVVGLIIYCVPLVFRSASLSFLYISIASALVVVAVVVLASSFSVSPIADGASEK